MAVSNFVYNTFFKKSSSAALTVVVGAILFERGVDAFTDSVFEYYNRGRLWKNIAHLYPPKPED
uniref:Complex III subunit 9 n=1 Tax=Tetranychus urticae TaxID=32264 RepID=T1KS03_TETUR